MKWFKRLFSRIRFLIFFFVERFKNRRLGYRVTERGKVLIEYLTKVILDNHQPQNMEEFGLEKDFNPKNLRGNERLKQAENILWTMLQFF